MKISSKKVKEFQNVIWAYYKKHARSFAWRQTHNPYHILVSEIMLQQTQTSRVAQKYESFLKRFPTIKGLAQAPLSDVLLEWQGLGYNRRALYLKKTAEAVVEQFAGNFPQRYDELLLLPGIGQSTAGALMAFAFNKGVPFIETNIRTVYIYFFFRNYSSVSDTMIREVLNQTIDSTDPRHWYYALYDYGTMLKSQGKQLRELHQKSSHYKKQSRFEGSNRQIRSHIIKALLQAPQKAYSTKKLIEILQKERIVIEKNLSIMNKEGLIVPSKGVWRLS